ncbi:hypothetical protein VTN00DRAFT_5232 [Thermoascus crustaceus]|uniref:uncharacterized protein n=1 Tax=Thermoascus crustaceus TaxID=5088 RepID=UPI003741FB93
MKLKAPIVKSGARQMPEPRRDPGVHRIMKDQDPHEGESYADVSGISLESRLLASHDRHVKFSGAGSRKSFPVDAMGENGDS